MTQSVNLSIDDKNYIGLDLVDEVRKLLALYGVAENKIQANFDENQFIKMAVGKPAKVQLVYLNRYWTLQLMSLQKNTTDIRIYLVKEYPDIWLNYFKTRLIHFIALNDLPGAVSL